MNPLHKIQELRGAIRMPTYTAGLIQAKAYRNLEQSLQLTLKPFGITLSEWAFLGTLSEYSEMRVTEISDILGVKKPMATAMVSKLSEKNMVERFEHATDSRVVLVRTTQSARDIIPEIESTCRTFMKDYLKDIPGRDVLAYLRVLAALAQK
jgi:DNA-binding MarR family transcriptional regulator